MPSPISNFFIKSLVNSPLHPLLGDKFAVITLTGRKTGRPFSTPINVMDVDGILTTLSMADRTWWRNLRGGRSAQLRHRGRKMPVRAEILTQPEEVALGLAVCFRVYPGIARYFGVKSLPGGQADADQVRSAAADRVLIRLFPV